MVVDEMVCVALSMPPPTTATPADAGAEPLLEGEHGSRLRFGSWLRRRKERR